MSIALVFVVLLGIIAGVCVYYNIIFSLDLIDKINTVYMNLWLYGSIFIAIYPMILHAILVVIWAVMGFGKEEGILPDTIYQISSYMRRNAQYELKTGTKV